MKVKNFGNIHTTILVSGVRYPIAPNAFVSIDDKLYDDVRLEIAKYTDIKVISNNDYVASSESIADAIVDNVPNVAPSQNSVFDALALKSNTGHTHTAINITDFSTAVKAAAVADSINNGTLDVAPSQNAVFDALALKLSSAKIVAYDSSPSIGGAASESVAVTGLLSTDTILSVCQKVPGSLLTAQIGFDAPGNGTLVIHWRADPGPGSVMRILVLKI